MTEHMKMPKPIDAPRRLTLQDSRPLLLRVGTALAIAMGFLWVTSQVDPQPSSAGSNIAPRPIPAETNASARGGNAPSLGTLEGKQFSVHVTASNDGPRYTVIDINGDIVASGLTKTEMYVRYPELRLETLTATPLMMAPANYRD